MRHHRVENARGGKDARNAGAGMRAGADEIEMFDVFAAIVRPEPGALSERRLKAKTRAFEGQEAGPGNPVAS